MDDKTIITKLTVLIAEWNALIESCESTGEDEYDPGFAGGLKRAISDIYILIEHLK